MQTSIQSYILTNFGVTQLIYSAADWVRVTLRLESAGPVVYSTRQDILPVLSGKGRLLPLDTDVVFTLPRGDRLYLAAEAANRVGFMVEPMPYLAQFLAGVDHGVSALAQLVSRLTGKAPIAPSQPTAPCPPGIPPRRR